METKNFFTADFYENPQLTLDIFNQLLTGGYVAYKDMYESGRFLFMDVFNNDKTKHILSQVISDLEAYKLYDKEGWLASAAATEISLCGLHDEHCRTFSLAGKEIKWDAEVESFVFDEYK